MTSTPLVLGAMMFGTRIDEPTSFALLDRFVEAGGEWIDTADCYSFWASDTGHGGRVKRCSVDGWQPGQASAIE